MEQTQQYKDIKLLFKQFKREEEPDNTEPLESNDNFKDTNQLTHQRQLSEIMQLEEELEEEVQRQAWKVQRKIKNQKSANKVYIMFINILNSQLLSKGIKWNDMEALRNELMKIPQMVCTYKTKWHGICTKLHTDDSVVDILQDFFKKHLNKTIDEGLRDVDISHLEKRKYNPNYYFDLVFSYWRAIEGLSGSDADSAIWKTHRDNIDIVKLVYYSYHCKHTAKSYTPLVNEDSDYSECDYNSD